ncbi:hypothetical protein M5K25_025503 [Dendrobium thyrsiflorum]|uniref:Uncharacterized protein n=1 Tax=Dendrobium thyrsiflorum TaxID=117978 RepID=A0ABD0U452_DENTH
MDMTMEKQQFMLTIINNLNMQLSEKQIAGNNQWADLCKAYFIEAMWYHNGYTPTLDEYLENACVTVSGICELTTTYCLSDDLTFEAIKSLELYPPIVRYSLIHACFFNFIMIWEHARDPKRRCFKINSMLCEREKNVSETTGRYYIRCLIRNYWKKLNKEHIISSKYVEYFRKVLVDISRTAQCFYQYGDGYGELDDCAASSSSARRTANFKPTIWDDDYIQSLPIYFKKFHFPNSLVVTVPKRSDRASHPPPGYLVVYETHLRAGLRFPPPPELIDIVARSGVSIAQFSYRAMSVTIGLIGLFRDRGVVLTPECLSRMGRFISDAQGRVTFRSKWLDIHTRDPLKSWASAFFFVKNDWGLIERWGKLTDLPAPLHIGEEDIMRILKVPDIEHLVYEVRYLGRYIEEELLFKVGLSIHAGRSEARMLKKSAKAPEPPVPAPALAPKVAPKRPVGGSDPQSLKKKKTEGVATSTDKAPSSSSPARLHIPEDVLNHQCIGRRRADDLLLRRKDLEAELTHSLNEWNSEFVKVKYLQGEYKRKTKQTVLSSSPSPSSPVFQQITVKFQPKSCLPTATTISSSPTRRTANFKPTIWDDSYIQSLPIDFTEEKYIHQRNKLIEKVRSFIGHQHGLIEQLEFVDALCQLGLDYHFHSEIKNLLCFIISSMEDKNNSIEEINLNGSALLFRLLREHGINNTSILSVNALISCFKKERENFNQNHEHNIKGMLSLYEASYLAVEGEEELEEAGKLAMEHVKCIDKSLFTQQFIEEIDHALELPLHWRMSRLHTRWFIDAYGRRENFNPKLLELAKLDFNMVQSIYKAELQELSMWWRNLGLVCEELDFFRDRLVENYLWSLGITFQPNFGRTRKAITKIISLATTVDDIYDIYGTLDELKLFTNSIEEWKIDASQQLPDYMKICLITIFNTMNDIATSFAMEKALDILPCLKRAWVDLCKSQLLEAKWYHNGYTPTLDEYLENAWVSISGNCELTATYCLSDDLTIESLNSLEFYHPIIRYSSIIFRLYDDLQTSTAEIIRGDVPKSIQCYMKEKNVSESVARDYIKCLTRVYWKKLNQECTTFSKLLEPFRKALVGLPRTAQCFYQHRDGYTESNHETKDQINYIRIFIQL